MATISQIDDFPPCVRSGWSEACRWHSDSSAGSFCKEEEHGEYRYDADICQKIVPERLMNLHYNPKSEGDEASYFIHFVVLKRNCLSMLPSYWH